MSARHVRRCRENESPRPARKQRANGSNNTNTARGANGAYHTEPPWAGTQRVEKSRAPTPPGEISAVHPRVAPARDPSPRAAAHVTPPSLIRAHCSASAITAISILRSYTHFGSTARACRNASSAALTRIVALTLILEGGAMRKPPPPRGGKRDGAATHERETNTDGLHNGSPIPPPTTTRSSSATTVATAPISTTDPHAIPPVAKSTSTAENPTPVKESDSRNGGDIGESGWGDDHGGERVDAGLAGSCARIRVVLFGYDGPRRWPRCAARRGRRRYCYILVPKGLIIRSVHSSDKSVLEDLVECARRQYEDTGASRVTVHLTDRIKRYLGEDGDQGAESAIQAHTALSN
ncbi:hypothetical protein C8J57DRAFT_1242445 [Mycena rebaudengoi]|nr:hypothetical protein C8J57DRAFT_1242445 [Mycena rebaudengoi]